jgi:hypothetical protein
MSKSTGNLELTVNIIPNMESTPKGKLADVELAIGAGGGPFTGLKFIGFSIWEGRRGVRNLTLPSRPFTANNNERRNFSLLRPVIDGQLGALDPLRKLILDAYNSYEAEARSASETAITSLDADSREG